MSIALNPVNRLPVSTWNRLGVNSRSLIYEGNTKKTVPTPEPAVLPPGVTWSVGQNCASVLTVEEQARPSAPIRLEWNLKEGDCALQSLLVHAKAGSEITVLTTASSPAEAGGLHGCQIHLCAGEGARIHLIQSQLLGQEYTYFQDIGGLCMDRASILLTQIELGGKTLFCGCHIDLIGYESSFDGQISYLGHGSQLIDMNYTAVHLGQKSTSRLSAKGALMGNSSKLFSGTIDLRRGCKGSSGSESEEVLLLNAGVRNRTVPLILCGEENVEGNHSATIGEPDSLQLFYLMSRGLSQTEARKLVALGHLESICQNLPDEALRQSITAFSQEVFQHEQSIPQ